MHRRAVEPDALCELCVRKPSEQRRNTIHVATVNVATDGNSTITISYVDEVLKVREYRLESRAAGFSVPPCVVKFDIAINSYLERFYLVPTDKLQTDRLLQREAVCNYLRFVGTLGLSGDALQLRRH